MIDKSWQRMVCAKSDDGPRAQSDEKEFLFLAIAYSGRLSRRRTNASNGRLHVLAVADRSAGREFPRWVDLT